MSLSKFQAKLVQIVKAERGVKEVDGSNCGPRVNIYKSATDLPPNKPWKWCAGFVCWGVKETLEFFGLPLQRHGFSRPTTAGAWDFINWSLKQDETTTTKMFPTVGDIQPGDILVFKFSHIGFAVGYPDKGYVSTVEGNTSPENGEDNDGGGVFQRTRPVNRIRARIRINL